MDRIEFVVADVELGVGAVEACAEPVINGVGLVDILAGAERPPRGYAGFPPKELLGRLSRAGTATDVQVLRCICGDDACSWARVEVNIGPDEVVWQNVRGSQAGADAYNAVGPFRFSREGYERALAEPMRRV
jgi:hypothetical protein